MDHKRRFLIRRALFAIVTIGVVAWFGVKLLLGSRVQIGRETTYVLGPVTAQGTIDYPAALAEMLTKGVSPDENAAVLIDQAFGPSAIPIELRGRYFAWLGADPLPDQGDYFVDQGDIIKRSLGGDASTSAALERELKAFGSAQGQPWTETEYPLVVEWLKANAGPLELIKRATTRTQYCSPLMTFDGLEHLQKLRQAVRLLLTRAMFLLGENNTEAAWSDLLACHRLGQLSSQRAPNMTGLMVALAVDAAAFRGDAALMAYGLSVEQARSCQKDHEELLPLSLLSGILKESQRLESLRSVIEQTPAAMDVNFMLRRTNRMFDELVTVMNLSNSVERKQKIAAMDAELKRRIAVAQKPTHLVASLLFSSHRTAALADALHSLFLPSVLQSDTALTRTQVRRDLSHIGFALAAYHAEQGGYPESLDDLVPNYLNVVPLDKFTEKPLQYFARENGFLIYSVGDNGQDENGKIGGGSIADDVSLEIPPKNDE